MYQHTIRCTIIYGGVYVSNNVYMVICIYIHTRNGAQSDYFMSDLKTELKFQTYDEFKDYMTKISNNMLDVSTIELMWRDYLGDGDTYEPEVRTHWINDKIANLAPDMWNAELRGVVIAVNDDAMFTTFTIMDTDFEEITVYDYKKVLNTKKIKIGEEILIRDAKTDEDKFGRLSLNVFTRTILVDITPQLLGQIGTPIQ